VYFAYSAKLMSQMAGAIGREADAAEYDRLFDAMHYWAPADGPLEVGFLLSRGKEFLAVEVKHGEAVHPQHLRGLRAIAPLKGLRRRILVCLGPRRLRLEDGIEVLPVEAFLELLRDGKL